jgi:sugar phosphate isomerase/epimerase
MKLCFNINAFAGRKFKPFPQKPLEIITKTGYKWVELRLDKPYFWFEDLNFDRVVEIKNLLWKLRLKAPQIGAETCGGYERPKNDVAPPGQRFGPSFSDESSERRKLRIDYTKKAVDFAVALDVPMINSCSGYQPKTSTFKQAWQRVRNGYKEVAKYAKDRGILINIEYEPGKYGPGGLLLGNAKDTLKMIDEVGEPNLGVTLDIGHSVVCKEDVPKVIKMLAKEKVLRHIHIEDIKDTVHFHLIPGEGDIDFKSIFKTLKEVNYQGCVSVELYNLWDKNPVLACKKSYKYLMSNFKKYFME